MDYIPEEDQVELSEEQLLQAEEAQRAQLQAALYFQQMQLQGGMDATHAMQDSTAVAAVTANVVTKQMQTKATGKVKACQFFQRGHCIKGERCEFEHVALEPVGASPDDWTCQCGFINRARNAICGGHGGRKGCKAQRPEAEGPLKFTMAWVCKCGFENRPENTVCGSARGHLGCKKPRPGLEHLVEEERRAATKRPRLEGGNREPQQPREPKGPCTMFIYGMCASESQCGLSHDPAIIAAVLQQRAAEALAEEFNKIKALVPPEEQEAQKVNEPCKMFLEGCCMKGVDCPFRHDLQTAADLGYDPNQLLLAMQFKEAEDAKAAAAADTTKPANSYPKQLEGNWRNPTGRTKACKYFQEGTCTYGEKCLFPHVLEGQPIEQPEDWMCACGFTNKGVNMVCGGYGGIKGCKQPKPSKDGGLIKVGWTCSCGYANKPGREMCERDGCIETRPGAEAELARQAKRIAEAEEAEKAQQAQQANSGEWVCSCGFKNVARNRVCGGNGNVGCKAPRPEQQPGQTDNWGNVPPKSSWQPTIRVKMPDDPVDSNSWAQKQWDNRGQPPPPGSSQPWVREAQPGVTPLPFSVSLMRKDGSWMCAVCGFNNKPGNEWCEGPMGCQEQRPQPVWTCPDCKFRNRAVNVECGGASNAVGCKRPKP